MKTLKGITWNHTRGYAPLAVTSKVYNDFHPDVEIQWDIRSLWSFGEEGLGDLARRYDLLLVDHPFMGTVAAQGLFLPFDEHLPADELTTLRAQGVGRSFESYEYGGHIWALPVDAAAQVSAARADLLEKNGVTRPKSWTEVVQLAKETGKVGMPMAPMGLLGAFFGLYANQFEAPFDAGETWAMEAEKVGFVLHQLRDLFQHLPAASLSTYANTLLNRMAATDELWYCPVVYGYANYGMRGYAPNLLTFGPLPGNRLDGATLGGVGIAVSAQTQHAETALGYARWLASAECQATLYALSGGQPANRLAWEDDTLNALTTNFYRNTRETLETAFVRPRFEGFHEFQTSAARVLTNFLRENGSRRTVFTEWKNLFEHARYATHR